MQRALFVALAATVLAAAPSTAVRAQTDPLGTLDHLLCFKIKDPLTLATTADMMAELQPDFARTGCKLTKPLELCVPASKRNVVPAPADPTQFGQPLRDDYICYRAECEDGAPPADRILADHEADVCLVGRVAGVRQFVPSLVDEDAGGDLGHRQSGGRFQRRAASVHLQRVVPEQG